MKNKRDHEMPTKQPKTPRADTSDDIIALKKAIEREALLSLAPTHLYSYARLIRPTFYDDTRPYLKKMCAEIDHFLYGQSKKKVLIINAPPRFGKSITAQTASEYVFGRNPLDKIMTGSYNDTLSTTFAQTVRNTISTRKVDDDTIVYSDIFPDTRIKYGEAAMDLWALEGAHGKSYLATSPGGTATGFGVNKLIIDDIIKNSVEALNQRVLDARWEWFTSTMLQRLEGDWRIVVIMTRWATGDLAGRIIKQYGDLVRVVSMPAVNADGSMLCDAVLTRADYDLKVQEMLRPIAEANYLQKPIDLEGQLYSDLMSYEQLPEDLGDDRVWAYTDTADSGSDYLCTIVYRLINDEIYVIDIVFTQEDMDKTEGLVADALYSNDVYKGVFESNNGGRYFSKNVERRIKESHGSNKTIIESVPQTKNKQARILTSSAWVAKHVYMPPNWHARFVDFYQNVTTYQAKGKNEHDDAPDVLASLYEHATGKSKPTVYNKAMTGMPTSSRRASPRGSYWQR